VFLISVLVLRHVELFLQPYMGGGHRLERMFDRLPAGLGRSRSGTGAVRGRGDFFTTRSDLGPKDIIAGSDLAARLGGLPPFIVCCCS